MQAPIIYNLTQIANDAPARIALDAALLSQINRLIPQLSRSAPPIRMENLKAIVHASCTDLFVAIDASGHETVILGMLTLVHFQIPTGLRAWIEDVVVDDPARGRGVGAALLAAAQQRARELGVKTLDLTSNPSRKAAHHLYESAGFVPRDTGVYRYLPKSTAGS